VRGNVHMSTSHQEIELRLAIADPAGLARRLQAAGARVIGQGLVRTTAYDFPDRRLRRGRRTLRVREDWTGTTLTAKVPLTREADEDAGMVKARHEINVPLAPGLGPDIHLLLQSIGLHETLRYEKTRTSWDLSGAHRRRRTGRRRRLLRRNRGRRARNRQGTRPIRVGRRPCRNAVLFRYRAAGTFTRVVSNR